MGGNGEPYLVVNDVAYRLEVGVAYEVNNVQRHYAVNHGSLDRVHLIFEYLPYDVGSYWTTDEAPLNQHDFKSRLDAKRMLLHPDDREEFDREQTERKKKLREALEHRIDAARRSENNELAPLLEKEKTGEL